MATLKLKQAGQCELATCSRCNHQWSTRKSGGAKKCPRCQASFKGEK